MINLFRFLVRYHLFFLFVLLEIFAFYLIYQNNNYQQAAFVNVANRLNGRFYATYKGVTDYFYLRSYNDSLVAENASLRAQLLYSKYNDKADSVIVRDTSDKYIQNYTYIPAQVIRNSVNNASNLIYLDKGTRHGIAKYMGVISKNGIVGQVISVTDNYSAVKSVLSKDFKVSARFKKNKYFGNLHWTGGNTTTAVMEEIPKHVPVEVGDTVMTSGFSEFLPRDIMVGTIKTRKADPEKNFYEITVNLSTDFQSLSYVYVVNNLRKDELQKLDTLSTPKTR